MPLNLYNYHTAKLVGDDYQNEIPSVAWERLRSQLTFSQPGNNAHEKLILRYRNTILKDPDLAAEFASRYMARPLYGGDEQFIADNATDLQNLIVYMRKFGVNDAMRDRIMRGDISHRMNFAEQILDTPLDPKFNKEILTATSLNLAMYAAKFEKGRRYNASPESFWKQVRERILTDRTAVAVYMTLSKRRWPEGEEVLLRAYEKDSSIRSLLTWVVDTMNIEMGDFMLRVHQIDNKREHQN